jgi:hypothetical protein
MNTTHTVHGLSEKVAWDDYRIPAHVWKNLVIEHDHWVWLGSRDVNPQIVMTQRILGWPRDLILAVVPTCGVAACANPAHLCATMRNHT